MLLAASAGCQGSSPTQVAGDPTPAQPYAGLQERDIRALAPERVADLLAGRGAGYALAAELNHYPGPTHVLELGVQLDLSPEQQDAVSSIKTAMQQEAVQFGTQLVDLEEELDQAFRSGAITPEKLTSLTNNLADVEGRLRNVHLRAHLQTVEVLTQEQVARYDELRGYVAGEGDQPSSSGEHESHGLHPEV
ncbi:MAG: hypothetical protein HY532_02095 [Chloroflexi bacterium]|nr:hypothetical protein [Chloroflexota bacterium]